MPGGAALVSLKQARHGFSHHFSKMSRFVEKAFTHFLQDGLE